MCRSAQNFQSFGRRVPFTIFAPLSPACKHLAHRRPSTTCGYSSTRIARHELSFRPRERNIKGNRSDDQRTEEKRAKGSRAKARSWKPKGELTRSRVFALSPLSALRAYNSHIPFTNSDGSESDKRHRDDIAAMFGGGGKITRRVARIT